MNEINVYSIHVGRELSQHIQLCFHLATVVAAAPIPNSFLSLSNCAPCDRSATVSLSGHRVATMRRRRSTSCSSGTLMWKGRLIRLQPLRAFPQQACW